MQSKKRELVDGDWFALDDQTRRETGGKSLMSLSVFRAPVLDHGAESTAVRVSRSPSNS